MAVGMAVIDYLLVEVQDDDYAVGNWINVRPSETVCRIMVESD